MPANTNPSTVATTTTISAADNQLTFAIGVFGHPKRMTSEIAAMIAAPRGELRGDVTEATDHPECDRQLLHDDRDADGGEHALDHGRGHQRREASGAQHAKCDLQDAGSDDCCQEGVQ